MFKVLIFVIALAVPIFGYDAEVQKVLETYKNVYQEYTNCGTDANYNKTIHELQKIFPNFYLAANSTFYDAFFTLAANFDLTFTDEEKLKRISITEKHCKEEYDSLNCKVMLLPDYVACFINQKDKGIECLRSSVNETKTFLQSFCRSTKYLVDCLKPIFDDCKSNEKNGIVFNATDLLCNANRAHYINATSNSCKAEPSEQSDVHIESSTVPTTEKTSNINGDDKNKLTVLATEGPSTVNKGDNRESSTTTKASSTVTTVNKDDNGKSSTTTKVSPTITTINNDSNGESATSTTVQPKVTERLIASTPAIVPSNEATVDKSKSSQKQFNVYLLISLVAMFINFTFN